MAVRIELLPCQSCLIYLFLGDNIIPVSEYTILFSRLLYSI